MARKDCWERGNKAGQLPMLILAWQECVVQGAKVSPSTDDMTRTYPLYHEAALVISKHRKRADGSEVA